MTDNCALRVPHIISSNINFTRVAVLEMHSCDTPCTSYPHCNAHSPTGDSGNTSIAFCIQRKFCSVQ